MKLNQRLDVKQVLVWSQHFSHMCLITVQSVVGSQAVFSGFVLHDSYTAAHTQPPLRAIVLLSPALPRHIISFDLCVSVPVLIPSQRNSTRTWARNKGQTHVAVHEQYSYEAYLYSSVGTVKPCLAHHMQSPLPSTPRSPTKLCLSVWLHPFTAHSLPFPSSPSPSVTVLNKCRHPHPECNLENPTTSHCHTPVLLVSSLCDAVTPPSHSWPGHLYSAPQAVILFLPPQQLAV